MSETGQISKICNELIPLRIMDCVFYYCFANHPNTLWIKTTILIMSQFIWVRNSGTTLCANYQQGLQSSQGLTEAPECASQMAHHMAGKCGKVSMSCHVVLSLGLLNIFTTLQLVAYGANGLRESKVQLAMSLMTRFWNYTLFILLYSIGHTPSSHDTMWEGTTQGLGSQEMAIIGGHLGFYM